MVSFNKPEILNQVGALEIFKSKEVYYKVRWDGSKNFFFKPSKSLVIVVIVCKLAVGTKTQTKSFDFYWILNNQVDMFYCYKSKPFSYSRSDITVVCKAMEFGQFPLGSDIQIEATSTILTKKLQIYLAQRFFPCLSETQRNKIRDK